MLRRYALFVALLLFALPIAGSPALAQEPGTSFTGEFVAVKMGIPSMFCAPAGPGVSNWFP